MSILKKKISELTETQSVTGAYTIVTDSSNESKKIALSTLTSSITSDVLNSIASVTAPNLDVKIKGGIAYYKIANMTLSAFNTIQAGAYPIKIALVRWHKVYRKYPTINNVTRAKVKGRKWTVVDDTNSTYISTVEIGGTVPSTHKNKIFWTTIKILPRTAQNSCIGTYDEFPFSAEEIIARYTYYTVGQRTTRTFSSLSAAMQNTGNYINATCMKKTKLVGGGTTKIFRFSMNVGLVAYRDIKVSGVTKRVFGNIVPLKACFTDAKGQTLSAQYTFKRINFETLI